MNHTVTAITAKTTGLLWSVIRFKRQSLNRCLSINGYPTSRSSASKSALPFETLSTSPVMEGLLNRTR